MKEGDLVFSHLDKPKPQGQSGLFSFLNFSAEKKNGVMFRNYVDSGIHL